MGVLVESVFWLLFLVKFEVMEEFLFDKEGNGVNKVILSFLLIIN